MLITQDVSARCAGGGLMFQIFHESFGKALLLAANWLVIALAYLLPDHHKEEVSYQRVRLEEDGPSHLGQSLSLLLITCELWWVLLYAWGHFTARKTQSAVGNDANFPNVRPRVCGASRAKVSRRLLQNDLAIDASACPFLNSANPTFCNT